MQPLFHFFKINVVAVCRAGWARYVRPGRLLLLTGLLLHFFLHFPESAAQLARGAVYRQHETKQESVGEVNTKDKEKKT